MGDEKTAVGIKAGRYMSEKRCVIIGASPEKDLSFYNGLIKPGDTVVCADGGYKKAALCGIRPDAIIGDFDSAPPPDDAGCEIIRLPEKKDDTDTMFCIKEFGRRGFKDFILLGMTGGRSDHTLANYSALLYLSKRGMRGCITDESSCCYVLNETELEVTGKKGSGFGIFPFGCGDCTVTLRGFLYEVEEYVLSADMPIGVSNTIVSDRAEVSVSEGSALVMIYNK